MNIRVLPPQLNQGQAHIQKTKNGEMRRHLQQLVVVFVVNGFLDNIGLKNHTVTKGTVS